MKISISAITLVFFFSNLQSTFAENFPVKNSLFENEAQRNLFGKEVQRFILENPEVIIEAIKLFQENQEKESAATELQLLKSRHNALFEDGYSYVGGNEHGKITIVEFVDYKCGYCKKAHDIIWEVLKNNPDVKYIIKELPILGNQSVIAAQALLSVLLKNPNEVYRNFSEMLMTHNGTINVNTLKDFAKKAGAKDPDLETAMKSEEVNLMIAKNMALAKELGIQGTPTFVIGDQIIRGFISENYLRELIEIIRERL